MKRLTPRQQDILEFIKRHIQDNGYPPTVKEIADGVGLASTSTVHGHLERMQRNGFILRNGSKTRAIEIVEADRVRIVARILEKDVDGTFKKLVIGGNRYVLDPVK